MRPRILLLMDTEDQYAIGGLEHEDGHCSFVRYSGLFTPEYVERYLVEHRDQFDAVAVFSIPNYDKAREAAEKHFNGPRILLHTALGYMPPKGQYVCEVEIPILLSEFDELVERHFRDLEYCI